MAQPRAAKVLVVIHNWIVPLKAPVGRARTGTLLTVVKVYWGPGRDMQSRFDTFIQNPATV